MRLSQGKVVIGIYGHSCGGKTTIADCIALALGATARHCGDLLRARARQQGVELSALPPEVHNELDDGTRSWVRAAASIAVVEGGFLDCVLAGDPKVILVCVAASEGIRAERWRIRFGVSAPEAAKQIRDRFDADATLRRSLYSGITPSLPGLTFNTDGETAADSATAILGRLEAP
jgi:cytidylate kinase